MNSKINFNRNLQQILIIISIVLIVYFMGAESGETCRRKDINGNDEVFECPRLFESRNKRFCCGFTPQDRYCCSWSKKSRDIVRNPTDIKYFVDGIVGIIILVLLIIGGLIVCCCVCACCLMSRKRQRRGQVLGHLSGDAPLNGTSVTTANSGSYPTSNAYPNAYPMQNVTAPYPTEQPPPYNFNNTQPPYNPSYPIK